jgi:hypothetical protein
MCCVSKFFNIFINENIELRAIKYPTYKACIKKDDIECFEYLFGGNATIGTREMTAQCDAVNCFAYMMRNKTKVSFAVINMVVSFGSIKCLKYLHTMKRASESWNAVTCATASNSLECLIYLHEHGCPWNVRTCVSAVCHGNLGCLTYAHTHGCPWNVTACHTAAMFGEFECLMYLHENGCPWDYYVCEYAANEGFFECFEYAFLNGCPVHLERMRKTVSRDISDNPTIYAKCYKYAIDHPRNRLIDIDYLQYELPAAYVNTSDESDSDIEAI